MTTTLNNDLYQRITKQIVAAIEAGAASGCMPWHASGTGLVTPSNARSQRPYRGINVLVLWAVAQARGYATGLWATYAQWQQLGAQVRRGEKAAFVVFWKASEREREADGEEHPEPGPGGERAEQENGKRLIARDYAVFNAAQVEGYTPPERPEQGEGERIEHVETFVKNLGADIHQGDFPAGYSPQLDQILMPWFSSFPERLDYYAVLAHELCHNADSRIMPRRSKFSLQKPWIDVGATA